LDIPAIKKKYDEALAGLAANCKFVADFDRPVLFEGCRYHAIWLECAPYESLVYAKHAPEVAKATHEAFFHHQREDGYIPFNIGKKPFCDAIQMVVPIAATALETADLLGDEAFLANAYDSCSKWDAWLATNRNTRGTGLCELFCQWDVGHDGSPRTADLPHSCPDQNAAQCEDVGGLPYIAPDLSATVYGGRVALGKMAERLGRTDEAGEWRVKAERIRQLIIKHCYDPEDECFYDVNASGEFVRIRGDILSRVFSEHVVDQAMFDRIYERHIKDAKGFWTPYPMPSIAASDPSFVKPIPANCWGGASQALTALRTPRWFYHYGREDDHKHLMKQWVEALLRSPCFMQQMDPWTGEFTESNETEYSPAMLVFIDFVDRLGLLEEKA
jgi:hypothetical protein